MIKYDRQQKIDSVNGALALRPQIEKVVKGADGNPTFEEFQDENG